MEEDGITVSPLGWHQEEEEIKGIKNGGFKVSPVGHSSKDMRIPKRDGMMHPNFLEEKLLHAQVKGHEISSKKEVPSDDDIPE